MSQEAVILRGVVGTDDRPANFNEDEYKRKIKRVRLRAAPYIAMLEGGIKEKAESERYNRAVEPIVSNRGTVVDVYTDANLADAYASGGVEGTVLYLKMSEADVKKVIPTDIVTVWNESARARRRCYVRNVSINGSSSYALVSLRETDTGNALAGATLLFTVTGNAQPEYAPLPAPMLADPVWFTNQVQTFSESVLLTNRQLSQKERTDPALRARARLQAVERMKRKKQLTFLTGVYDELPGSNGTKKTTFTGGFLWALQQYYSENIFDFATCTDTSLVTAGATLAQGLIPFLEGIGEKISQNGEADHKTCFTSSWVMMMLNRICRDQSYYGFETGQTSWGSKVATLVMPGQDWKFIEDPVFSQDDMLRKAIVVVEKHLVGQKVMEGLKFIGDSDDQKSPKSGKTYVSGIKEGWEETVGFVHDNLDPCAWIDLALANAA